MQESIDLQGGYVEKRVVFKVKDFFCKTQNFSEHVIYIIVERYGRIFGWRWKK